MLADHTTFFWVTAVLAVLFIGIAKGGFGGGVGVLATPLLSLTMPVAEAAALLLPILIVADILNVFRYWSVVDWKITRFLLPAGLAGIVLGSFFFNYMADNERLLKVMMGSIALGFVIFQLSRRLIFGRLEKQELPAGLRAILGVTAGFTSTVAHVGGPPITIYLLPMRLPRAVYVGTFLMFFFVVNLVKLIPYGILGLLEIGNLPLTLVLLPLVYLGSRLGNWMNKNVSEFYFQIILYTLLTLTGIQLILGQSFIALLAS